MSQLAFSGGEVDPCRQIWAAVLNQAVDDLSGAGTDRAGPCHKNARAIISTRARRWFAAANRGIGSFVWICHILDLDPDRTRNVIMSRFAASGRRLTA